MKIMRNGSKTVSAIVATLVLAAAIVTLPATFVPQAALGAMTKSSSEQNTIQDNCCLSPQWCCTTSGWRCAWPGYWHWSANVCTRHCGC